MQNLTEVLKTIPLFSMLSEEQLEKLSENAKIFEFCAGENITEPHDDSLTVVLSGSVAVMKNELLMRILSPGLVSGVASLYGDGEPISHLKSNTASSLAFLRGEDIRCLIHKDPCFAEGYIKFLTSRIRFLNTRIRAYTSGSAEAKLAFHILYSDENGSGAVDIGVSMSALADMLDIGRASLYRAMESLTSSGAVERNGSSIKIINKGLLLQALQKNK